jgi:hypothetical protein
VSNTARELPTRGLPMLNLFTATMQQVEGLKGRTVEFMYDNVQRRVEVEKVKQCSKGLLIIGKDKARQGQYRSFNTQKIGELNVFPFGWDEL